MYPWYTEPRFTEKIMLKKEMQESVKENPNECLKTYQRSVAAYINPKSPYDSIMLYMKTGTGKTLASIAIAENFINTENRKVILITKNRDLAQNFLVELLTVCSSYTTQTELTELNKLDGKEKAKKIKSFIPRINKNYTFRHHEEFKKTPSTFTNKIVIIDEVHKMVGNKGYSILMDILKKSYNYKLIILTATPIFDSLLDIFQLNNLLNAKINKFQMPVSQKDLISSGLITIRKDIENITIFKDKETILSLTDKGRQFLKETLKAKVSYVKPDIKNFPVIIEKGEYLTLKEYKTDIKLVPCYMDTYQETRYLKAQKILMDKKDFNRNLEHLSNMIYPDIDNRIYTGNAGFVKAQENNRGIFKRENIGKYSAKLIRLLENIQNSPGKVCVYSSFVNDDGLAIIQACLKTNLPGIPMILLSGNDSPENRKKRIDDFNMESNDNGGQIKILLFSDVLSEGITLKCVRSIHIFEASWNFSSLDQITGRVVRNNSHSRLPQQDRNVSVYRYCSIPKSDPSLSLDLSKYIKAGRKDFFIKQFERDITKASFLCNANYQNNTAYSKQYENNSRECEYDSCIYTCDSQPASGEIDNTTYYLPTHNPTTFGKIRDYAKNMGGDITSARLSAQLGVPLEDVKAVMRILVKSGEFVIKGNNYTKKLIKTPNKIAVQKEKIVENISNQILVKEGKVYLTPKSRGKICASYLRNDIIKFFEYAGLVPPEKGTKLELCVELEKQMNGK